MQELNGRPLLDTRLDQGLYVARPEVEARLVTAARRGLNALLLGARGSGKTTLLRHLAYVLREEGRPSTWLEGAVAENAAGFLALLARRLGASDPGGAPLVGAGIPSSGVPSLIERVHAVASLPAPGERRTLLVDGLPSPVDAHTLFGRLRDEMWQLPITWIVAADERDRGDYLTPPADAFFDTVVEVPPLSHEQRGALLRARAGDLPHLEAIAERGSGNPRELLTLAREVATGEVPPQELLEERAALHRKSALLGAPATMLLAELEASGPASASDERLLRRLGWTRARAVQVFKQLERAGVVTASEQRGGAGRPRKIYSLTGAGKNA